MADHTRTEKIGGDFIFIFVVFQVERETVMTVPFKIFERIGLVAYRLELPRDLKRIHDVFHVSI